MDLFIAVHMTAVRIIPEHPTKAPATTRALLESMKPAAEVLKPERLFRKEMDTGITASDGHDSNDTPKGGDGSNKHNKGETLLALVPSAFSAIEGEQTEHKDAGNQKEVGKPTEWNDARLGRNSAVELGHRNETTGECHHSNDNG